MMSVTQYSVFVTQFLHKLIYIAPMTGRKHEYPIVCLCFIIPTLMWV